MCYKKDTMGNKRVADILARTYFSDADDNDREISVEEDRSISEPKARYTNINIPLVVANIILLFLLLIGWKSGILYNNVPQQKSEEQLFIATEKMPVVIKYDFSSPDATSTVKYFLSLKGVDASKFKALAFAIRFSSGKNHSIRLEFVNAFREVGEVGIPSIGNKWKDVIIPLSDVRGITSWRDVKQIGFIIDKWNVSTEKGAVYIDKVRFIEGTK